jgi:hypothetical protein
MGWTQSDLFTTIHASGGMMPPDAEPYLASYATPGNNQQHVIYLDKAGNIHELLFENSKWTHNNLSSIIAGSKLPAASWQFNAYGLDSSQYINWVDRANDANTFRNEDGNWVYINWKFSLQNHTSNEVGFPITNGLLCGYNDDLRHICYVAQDAYIHEIYNGDGIGINILPSKNYPQRVLSAIALYGYATDWNSQEHVIWLARPNEIGGPGTLNEFVHKDDGWLNNQIASDVALGGNTALHAHLTGWNDQQHVHYIDGNDHIIEHYNEKNSNTWHPRDLIELASQNSSVNLPGYPGGGAGRFVTGYTSDWNKQQHINYVDAMGNVNELYFSDNQWRANNLMKDSGTNNLAHFVPVAGHSTPWNKQVHVFYIDQNNHINELVYKS